MNKLLAVGLAFFLTIASIGVAMSINNAVGAYLDTTSWLVILGMMGILDVSVLVKADSYSNRHSR